MNYIILTKNEITLVDDEDYDFLISLGYWHVTNQGYAKHDAENKVCLLMHRLIMERVLNDSIPDGLIVDHKNRNKLDNRRENLRLATYSQNAINSKIPDNNTSGYKGVGFHNKRQQWRARIGKIHLGWYSNIEDAIEAREKAEEILYNNFSSN